MFCVQCEQTIRTPAGNGCAYAQGMCGKTAETSDLQGSTSPNFLHYCLALDS